MRRSPLRSIISSLISSVVLARISFSSSSLFGLRHHHHRRRRRFPCGEAKAEGRGVLDSDAMEGGVREWREKLRSECGG
ncbi:hypothetical protein TIFTF001_041061 [Ficus carica]|uniref:Secreted protein n=1 Tax=Ficus carica TaxID=3494 RepID=A0AA87Z0Q0_FICCA|nr:hypothetical protein TIFTF001_041061 [Ficus carica]